MIAALALVYAAARPLVGPLGALVSVLIVDGLHYFNYTAAKFNHDVIQLPFWALAGYSFHRALRQRQLTDWLLLGLGARPVAVGEIFRGGAGGADGGVRARSTATRARCWPRPGPISRPPSR